MLRILSLLLLLMISNKVQVKAQFLKIPGNVKIEVFLFSTGEKLAETEGFSLQYIIFQPIKIEEKPYRIVRKIQEIGKNQGKVELIVIKRWFLKRRGLGILPPVLPDK